MSRHIKTSAFVYAIFGSGTLFWYNYDYSKTIKDYFLQNVKKFIDSMTNLGDCLWFVFMLLHVMKIFAMFTNSIREQNMLTFIINNSAKIDEKIKKLFIRHAKRFRLNSWKLYFIDMIGFGFLFVHCIVKNTVGVSEFIDSMSFVRAVCMTMHSSFCKLIYVTYSLFRDINEQFVFLKNFICHHLTVFVD